MNPWPAILGAFAALVFCYVLMPVLIAVNF